MPGRDLTMVLKPMLARLAGAMAMATALLLPAPAVADVLLSGVPLSLPTGTSTAAEPLLAGAIIEDRTDAFSFAGASGTVSGSIQSRVLRAIDGTVDFYWRVFNDGSSSNDIGAFRLGEMYASEYRVNWRNDSSGDQAPNSAYRFTGVQSSAFNFTFTHLNDAGGFAGLGAGQSSYFMFLDTDATNYAYTGLMDVADTSHTHISGLFSTFAPVIEAVPEPASLWLVVLALVLLPMRRQRR